MKHRKLFPDDNSTGPGQPTNCSYCLPGCPLTLCMPTSALNFTPRPPPPPPPPPPQIHVSPYVIFLICITVSFLFFIIFNIIKSQVREVDQAPTNINRPQQSLSDGSEEDRVDESRVEHPAWLISTVGLQQSVINSIAVFKYKKSEGLVEGTECAVCLNEFQEDERLRLLPKCNHAFHVSCIDTWLKSHTNCPLCRASIVSSRVPAPLRNQNSVRSTGIVNSQIDNSGSDRRLGERNVVQGHENRTGTTEEGEVPQAANERVIKRGVNSNSFDFGLADSRNVSADQVNDAENSQYKQDGENPSTSRQSGSPISAVPD